MFCLILPLLLFVTVPYCTGEPTWNSLKITWGVNIFSSRVFASMPRTVAEAEKKGFTALPGSCSGGKFLGQRYTPPDEVSVVLIYDVNGFIAGIQQGLPKSDVMKVNTSNMIMNVQAYQLDSVHDQEVYLRTAYFVNPEIICSSGRTTDEFNTEGTGTNLYLQNGTDPVRDSIKIPLYQNQTGTTMWTEGQCFYSMGKHYWYNVYEGMNCDRYFPFFLLYNRGKLTGFGFATFGMFDFSNRLEHPPKISITRFLPDPVPSCIYEKFAAGGGVTTMHVYFSVRPWNLFC